MTHRTFARVCLLFLRYRLWCRWRSAIEPCSACILLPPEEGNDPSLEVVLVTDARARWLLRLVVFTESVGDGDWTFLRFLKLSLTPNGWIVPCSSSSSSSITSSSSAISCKSAGCLGLGGLSKGSIGGVGVVGLPSGAPHQGKQHFQAPTSVPT